MLLEDATYGEALAVDRRRRDETQAQAAERLGITVYAYRKAEASAHRNGSSDSLPVVDVEPLHPGEQCRILRRRAGLTLDQLAERMGCTAWWIAQMEHGKAPVDRLVEHWRTR